MIEKSYTKIGLDKYKYVYIAGPFFNEPQQLFVKIIEGHFEQLHYPYYSPRLHATPFRPGDQGTTANPEKTLTDNAESIDHCAFMIAIMDYLLPASQVLGLVELPTPPSRDIIVPPPPFANIRSINTSTVKKPQLKMKPIKVPDTGTVWEIGFARARGVPVYGITLAEDHPINLMLAMCLEGIIAGKEAFMHAFLPNIDPLRPLSRDLRSHLIDTTKISNPKEWRII